MSLVLELRGCNTAKLKDIKELQKWIKRAHDVLRDDITANRDELKAVTYRMSGIGSKYGSRMGSKETRTEGPSGTTSEKDAPMISPTASGEKAVPVLAAPPPLPTPQMPPHSRNSSAYTFCLNTNTTNLEDPQE